jgi:hypothetical protein
VRRRTGYGSRLELRSFGAASRCFRVACLATLVKNAGKRRSEKSGCLPSISEKQVPTMEELRC